MNTQTDNLAAAIREEFLQDWKRLRKKDLDVRKTLDNKRKAAILNAQQSPEDTQ